MFDEFEPYLRDLPRRELCFEAGEHLFHIGDRVRVLHMVRSGAAHLIRHQSDGSALVLQRATSGAILAEASLHSDTYHCDAVSVARTHTLVFNKADLRAHFRACSEFASAWSNALAKELQKARLQSEILSLKTVTARLNAWLACNDGCLPPKGDWKRLSTQIGVSPEALYREIGRRQAKPT